ncbi:MAG: hypothetical protein ACLP1Q_01745 [Solirubrobacteraceae bacterium]
MHRIVLGGSLVAFLMLALIPAQVADAAAPPSPYTGEAIELTTSSATLKGTVYPGNEPTSYCFQYGTTSAYGAQTPTVPAGAGTQTIHVAVPVVGLSVDTTYHYRLVASNALGTIDGKDRTFTTKKIPLTFTVAAIPTRDPFGSPFVVTGTLSGTGSADHTVVLEANPFPYLAGFKAIGNPELTEAGGGFSFSVPGLTQNTQLRAATVETPPVNSRVMVEFVAVRVGLHVRPTGRAGYVRLYGTVTPAEFGARVSFQLLRPGLKPATVGRTIITGGNAAFSRFGHIVRIRRPGLYRALVTVANGAQVSNHSRAILLG